MNTRLLIWISLGFTLFACYWVSDTEGDETAMDPPVPHNQLSKRKTTTYSNSQIREVNLAASVGMTNLFSIIPNQPEVTVTNEPKDRQVSAIVSPQYVYSGKIIDETGQVIFLTDGTQNYVLKNGDSLPDGWRVKSITSEKLVLIKSASKQLIEIDLGATL